ncbi:MAG: hypothetical protein ACJ798_01020 [Phenylobacterium sp.]
MTRPRLDPADLSSATGVISVERLPKPVRDFGCYPDVGRLQAGDLILVSPVVKRRNAIAIERVQRQNQDAFDAQWIHAATYLGDNSLVEIDGGGVSVTDLHKYVPSHRILVRRALHLSGEDVGELIGYRIAVAALKAFKTKYGYVDLARIYLRTQQWRSAHNRFRPKSAAEAICSDYYNDAVAQVLGRGAASAKRNPFTPADLSASANMKDVEVPWARLQT